MDQYTAIEMIKAERVRQDDIWGGEPHDQDHTLGEWYGLISIQLVKGFQELTTIPTPQDLVEFRHAHQCKERMIKIAALALAALGVLPE